MRALICHVFWKCSNDYNALIHKFRSYLALFHIQCFHIHVDVLTKVSALYNMSVISTLSLALIDVIYHQHAVTSLVELFTHWGLNARLLYQNWKVRTRYSSVTLSPCKKVLNSCLYQFGSSWVVSLVSCHTTEWFPLVF